MKFFYSYHHALDKWDDDDDNDGVPGKTSNYIIDFISSYLFEMMRMLIMIMMVTWVNLLITSLFHIILFVLDDVDDDGFPGKTSRLIIIFISSYLFQIIRILMLIITAFLVKEQNSILI